MYGCDSWTIKKAKHWRIDAFELWCWRLLTVPWTARRSNQSILKESNPEYSLEELILKLKLQHSGHLMQRANSLGKIMMLGKIEDRKKKEWQRMRWLDGITNSWVWANSRRLWRTEKPGVLQSVGLQRVGHDLVTEQEQQQQIRINIICFGWSSRRLSVFLKIFSALPNTLVWAHLWRWQALVLMSAGQAEGTREAWLC